jgi:hypothetical protein
MEKGGLCRVGWFIRGSLWMVCFMGMGRRLGLIVDMRGNGSRGLEVGKERDMGQIGIIKGIGMLVGWMDMGGW